mmetsp:Transcript_29842/g.75542  ORF Transcript_29842/g.75542 Transcript_29842/m.75542 type:complete len:521 (-) Transcript_29842:154-1716(-)
MEDENGPKVDAESGGDSCVAWLFGFGAHPKEDDPPQEPAGGIWILVVFGLILAGGGLALAGWNEYRSLATEQTLRAAEASYIAVPCSPIDDANIGKLVYASCPITGQKTFYNDVPFLESTAMSPAIRIVADVEFFLWHEFKTTKEDKNGKKTTTYRHEKRWQNWWQAGGWGACRRCINDDPRQESTWDSRIDIGTNTVARAPIQFGDFRLDDYHLDQLGEGFDVPISCGSTAQDGEEAPLGSGGGSVCPPGSRVEGNTLYFPTAGEPKTDEGFNVRVSYKTYTVSQATVLAQQSDKATFEAWKGPYDPDYTVDEILDGEVAVEAVIKNERDDNFVLTWLLRVATFFMVWGGLQIMTNPLTDVGHFVPLIGPMLYRLFGCLLATFTFFMAAFMWCVVAGATWVAIRPDVGWPLLAAAFVSLFLATLWGCCKKKRYKGDAAENLEPSAPQEGWGGHLHFTDMVAKFHQQLQQSNPQAAAAIAPALAHITTIPPQAHMPAINCQFCGAMKDSMPICPKCGRQS